MTNTIEATQQTVIITPKTLQHHWQEHRGLSRRVIEAFPDDQLFTFSIGGMRTYALLAQEIMDLAGGGISGIATGDWKIDFATRHNSAEAVLPTTKKELLAAWDKVTDDINALFPTIAAERWQETEKAFGAYENKIWATLFYIIDNEIHHRAQGYVYLRALGIEPPPFWDRH